MAESQTGDMHGVVFVEGNAYHGSEPPDPKVLSVRTTWRCPSPGYVLELQLGPIGFNPSILLLQLVVTPPSGPTPDFPTEVSAEYSEQTDVQYEAVTILPEGPTLPVETLQ